MPHACAKCGATPGPGAAFCGTCGADIQRGPAFSFRRYLPGQQETATVPTALWIAVGLLVAAGLFVVVPALRAVPDTFRLIEQGDVAQSLGLFLLVVLVLLVSFGTACFYLALKLIEADRAGRTLTIVLAGTLCMGLLLGNDSSNTAALAIAGCAGVLGILTLVDEVRAFFNNSTAPRVNSAISVTAARRLVLALSYVLGFVGAAFLLLGDLAARFVLVGVVMVVVAGAGFLYAGRLIPADEQARKVITGLMAACIAGLLLLEPEATGLFMPMGVAGSVVALLWVPEDARQHFAPRR